MNFGIVYGLSAFGLSQTLGIEPREAKQFIDAYFEKYKGVRAFIDKTLEEARREQKVTTLFGRVRPIPDINSKNINQRGFAERTAVNTPLQGTAADLIKIAMIRIDAALRERGLKSRMTLQVHDELVFEVPEREVETMRTLVRDQMENVHPLTVPLLVEVGVGKNWRDLSRKWDLSRPCGDGSPTRPGRAQLDQPFLATFSILRRSSKYSREISRTNKKPAELALGLDGSETRPYMVRGRRGPLRSQRALDRSRDILRQHFHLLFRLRFDHHAGQRFRP